MTGAAFSKPPFSMVNHSSDEPALLSDIKARYAIMDTGVSYALVPAGDFLKIKTGLEERYGVNCSDASGEGMTSTYSCKCLSYSRLPDIRIGFAAKDGQNGKMFTLPKESYMKKDGENGCAMLKLTPTNEKFGKGGPEDYWILGDIFLQNYYSIYDYKNQKLGLIDSRDGAAGGGDKKSMA